MHGVVSSTSGYNRDFFTDHLDYQLFYHVSQIQVYHNQNLCQQNFNFDAILTADVSFCQFVLMAFFPLYFQYTAPKTELQYKQLHMEQAADHKPSGFNLTSLLR